MKSKKKLIVAASVIGAVLLAAIVSVVAVFAAPQQNVGSQVKVTYSVIDVAATVNAKYGYAAVKASGETTTTFTQIGTDATTFDSEDAESTATYDITSLELNSTTQRYVVFEYSFKNLSSIAMKVTGTTPTTINNMTVQYAVKTEAAANVQAARDFADWKGTLEETSLASIAQNNTAYVYIMVSVTDLTKGAEYSGNFAWTLEQA